MKDVLPDRPRGGVTTDVPSSPRATPTHHHGDRTDHEDHPYVVLHNDAVTPSIREIQLAPLSSPLAYRPGQYVLLGDPEERVPQRSYSVANAPRADARISLLITGVAGGATSTWVHKTLRPGGDVMLEGPYGTFVLDARGSRPVLLLGAGSGLAPVRAIAEHLISVPPGRDALLFFSARTSADLIDETRLLGWARHRPGFRYLPTFTGSPDSPLSGRIPAVLPRVFETLHNWEVFASGPPGFVVGCAHAAVALGAEPAHVHTEEFFNEPQPWSGSPPVPAPRKGQQ